MTRITGKGVTKFGNIQVTIIGDKRVKKIECSGLVKPYIAGAIHRAEGTMANGFSPDSDTMLQAFAYMTNIFGDDHVEVFGELDEMPFDPDAIY